MTRQVGKYELAAVIGTGATGIVYLATQPGLERRVAIKELVPALALDESFLERFRVEARLMARVDSPHCVRVFDFFEVGGRGYLVSEYIDGTNLRSVLRSSGRLAPEQALGVLRGALLGLGDAHAAGVIHSDVKPENMLADSDGISKLSDFGLAAPIDADLTEPGMVSGTPAYMSPEQASGARLDPRSDIYSAGAVLYEFLTGQPPFIAAEPVTLMRMHVSEPAPDATRANVPGPIAEIVTRALAKDPAQRHQSAREFTAELETRASLVYGADWGHRASIAALATGAISAAAALALGGAPHHGTAPVPGASRTAAGPEACHECGRPSLELCERCRRPTCETSYHDRNTIGLCNCCHAELVGAGLPLVAWPHNLRRPAGMAEET
ncbi:MAG: serine/threonine-protein kinase [Candidatus Dormibacteria bacterium]